MLNFPPLIWKMIIGETLHRSDLAEIDTRLVHFHDHLIALGSDTDDSKVLDSYELTWSIQDSLDRRMDLDQGDNNLTHLTLHSVHHFVSTREEFRLQECKEQTDAMRRGLSSVVPFGSLRFWTWSELEYRVCG